MLRWHWVGVAFLILAYAPSARGEIVVAATLEWLADHAMDSGVYRVTTVTRDAKLTDCYTVGLTLKEKLRGSPKGSINETYQRAFSSPASKMPIAEVGDEFLICFQHHRNGDKVVVQAINLTKPQVTGATNMGITSELKILRDGKQILAVFRKRIQDRPVGDPVEISDYEKDNRYEVDVPTELFKALWSGSAVYLRMPSDGSVSARK